jgi:hypothetical protein
MKNIQNIAIIGNVGLGTTIADVAKMKIEESVVVVKNLQEQIKEDTSLKITAPPLLDEMYISVPKSGKEARRERRAKERKAKKKNGR